MCPNLNIYVFPLLFSPFLCILHSPSSPYLVSHSISTEWKWCCLLSVLVSFWQDPITLLLLCSHHICIVYFVITAGGIGELDCCALFHQLFVYNSRWYWKVRLLHSLSSTVFYIIFSLFSIIFSKMFLNFFWISFLLAVWIIMYSFSFIFLRFFWIFSEFLEH